MATFSITDQVRRVQATGDGSVTEFSFSFQVNNTSEIKVYWGTTLKTESTHYDIKTTTNSLGLNTDGTGKVVFRTSPTDHTPPNNTVVTIISDIPMARTSVYTSGGNINASSLENDFDTLVMKLASHEERLDRGMVAPVDDAVNVDLTLPNKDTRKGRVLGFNATTGAPEQGPEIADVQSLANVTADIQTLAHIEDGTDATDAIQTVAGISSNVSTVAGVASSVPTVAGISSNVTTVAGIASNVTTVAGVSTNVSQVGPIAADVTSVAGVAADVTTVAGQITNNNLQTIAADIAAVITTANDLNEATSEIETVANSIANVDTVGAAITNVNQVASDSTDINTLAGISADIQALADIEDGTTATNTMQTVATNITDVNTFAARYRIGATNPATDNDEGDLFFNTTTSQMLVYNSGVWTEVGSNVPATLSIFEFTSGNQTTVFTGQNSNGVTLDYNTDNFFVALNGVIIPPEDYTATSSSTLTLDTGANSNDTVTIYSFTAFTINQPYLSTANGDASIAYNSSNSDALEITMSDNGDTAGPILGLKRTSITPSDNDLIGQIEFTGKNDANDDFIYSKITTEAFDVSDGSEDGRVRVTPAISGSITHDNYYEFGTSLFLNDDQPIVTKGLGSSNYTGTLDWETSGSQNGQVRLPLASGTIGYLAYDHNVVSSTNQDDVYFGGISGLPTNFNSYQVFFNCQPQSADTLTMTFQGPSGTGEITTAGAYTYNVDTNSTSQASSSSASKMFISGANVGTRTAPSGGHGGVSGSMIINGLDHDRSINEMPAHVFGQCVMFDNTGAFKRCSFGGALNTASEQEVIGFRFRWNSGTNFQRYDFRVYGLRNER